MDVVWWFGVVMVETSLVWKSSEEFGPSLDVIYRNR